MKQNVALAVAAAMMLMFVPAHADRDGEVRVLCSNGIKRAMETLLPAAERAIGQRIAIQFGALAVLRRTIEAGEPFDVAIRARAAKALIAFLTSPAAAQAMTASGVEPSSKER